MAARQSVEHAAIGPRSHPKPEKTRLKRSGVDSAAVRETRVAAEAHDVWTSGICGAVGRTPMIRLRHLSEATGCEILGKAEFLNPGGSVKDRAALGMIVDAERSGRLVAGGTIVEGTAGNTGIGLALLGLARGYKARIVVPETVSIEKITLLRALGVDVRTVPQVPYSNPGNYQHVARKLAEEEPGAWWANQFDNTANREAHFRTTGPEIWEQTQGRLSAFVAAIGSGGTIAGVGRYLKERDRSVRVVCADPHGAAMWSWIKHGHTRFTEGDSVAEGIGQNRVTRNLADAPIDDAVRVGDRVAVEMLYHLLRREGLSVGLSAAINVCAAVKVARESGRGGTVVTVLCDGGARYASTLFNPDWLARHDLSPRAPGLEFMEQL
ncbi:MAG: cysteine synthase A [Opitutaceae bacterium]|nr:cysteine synthase A [Opitutaceae bacterium]